MNRIVVIRIRGIVGASKEVRDTLYLLKLRKTNVAAIYRKDPSIIGMIKKVEPWVAWGEINKEVFKQLLLKRGRLARNRRFTEEYLKNTLKITLDEFVNKFFNLEMEIEDIPGLKPFFRLKPPSGGYPRKGIKYSYKEGGAYGYWGEDINNLLISMI
ncbi:50S ribosomal protein L30 [Nanoarchaeota archaeon NZ13-N]|nr:MAG: 50S ribosomal protein L30 [Nanoarchaeota archaeon NZ13-N]